ncbi:MULTISPECIES: YbaB/EbfC family nucleoid-associated protein [unclassified Breznakia]|uniref:YbaB/EbfC family nucleoid-associated protein n=1 Tax=unclassified Breznakia TaxID=2623764 RepID=UPI002475A19F|nr:MULTISPECIES: YbaB/EbfC family nucleoid-associated protein [unclassified Breznakia]MDH6366837.1 DNA-binding YbaB/EbfC family protein [Breznakia sp. PH1-1]MDH6404015.1 DNA-binding YbaB/EbfC family protein [Breznakia sp. PF1-11]MDH6411763.1 DNA-binding YbaB/EbfC family protein [Breznakia sp. PFB1-11]MDH6414003.1 DNA-binding YbaB/EbfC family protein [Breznakia sp. PFB1-14]MDH6416433.1 DNA-binding YbaB/EbfC family protein [Breznakia sp. PFB1-4]
MDLNALMKQAQKMQKDMAKQEYELKEKQYVSSVGGGVVEITMNGAFEVVSVFIKDEVLDQDNQGMIEELVQMAMNDVLKKATEEKEAAMASLTGGMKIPGM